MPADWAIACGCPDPMAKWRGAYATEAAAELLIAEAGGLAALFRDGMAAAAIAAVNGLPQQGDIGVLRVGDDEAGAIYVGPRWAFIASRGIGFASVDDGAVQALWRPHG